MLADAGNLTGFCRNNKDMFAMHDRQAGWLAGEIQRSAPGHPNAPRSTPNTLQRLNIGHLFILGTLAAHPAHSFGSQTVACSSSALNAARATGISVSPSFLAVGLQPQHHRRPSRFSSLQATRYYRPDCYYSRTRASWVPSPRTPPRRLTCESPAFPTSVHHCRRGLDSQTPARTPGSVGSF